MPHEHIHFVTGRLAEHSLRRVVESLSREAGFDYTIDVLPITVAALMTTSWVARHMTVPSAATRVLLPGYCGGGLRVVEEAAGVPVARGPRDLRRLPDFFGRQPTADDYGQYDIQIIAEINHCPRLRLDRIRSLARQLAADGADVIDVGCDPAGPWTGVTDVVRALKDDGHRVSIDSLDEREIEPAVRAGAELVLSVNSTNCAAACNLGCEVVVVPDDSETLAGLDETVDELAKAGVPLRIDPGLSPIGFGFAASLCRYADVRRRYPDAEMLIGTGNVTELTDVDSAGINAVLVGFCEELGIRSILTTQVVNWARSSVRECDLARRLMYYAVRHHVLPKNLAPGLVLLRDATVTEPTADELHQLASDIRDPNYRIFTIGGQVHVVSHGLHLSHADPFELCEQLLRSGPNGSTPDNLDASHAFYLGYEMCKAATAIALSKQYQQDESLDWSFLTRPEVHHYLKHQRPSAS
jgi:dihydropteroate synthase-like protein